MNITQDKRAVLLVNLGSPDSPSVKDVRKYLHQFLMDERVIDVPYLLRKFIVSAFILPFRPKRSAEAYRSIWWKDGSPLIVISRKVQRLLQEQANMPIELAMRYRNPSIQQGMQNLLRKRDPSVREIFLIPLFPHYAMSTYETVIVAVKKALAEINPDIELRIQAPFYDNPSYIEVLAESARPYLNQEFDHILFSYHGLPERHLKKTDPTGQHCLADEACCNRPSEAHDTCYRHQVFRTSELVANALGIPQNKYSISFQSRLGKDPWLKPYTSEELQLLPKRGVKKLIVICPAFVSDCLETLEEIEIGGRELFLGTGGEEFQMIPCINDHPVWIQTLAKWCREPEMIQQPAL